MKLAALASPEQAAAILVLHAHPQLSGDGRERLTAALRGILTSPGA